MRVCLCNLNTNSFRIRENHMSFHFSLKKAKHLTRVAALLLALCIKSFAPLQASEITTTYELFPNPYKLFLKVSADQASNLIKYEDALVKILDFNCSNNLSQKRPPLCAYVDLVPDVLTKLRIHPEQLVVPKSTLNVYLLPQSIDALAFKKNFSGVLAFSTPDFKKGKGLSLHIFGNQKYE